MWEYRRKVGEQECDSYVVREENNWNGQQRQGREEAQQKASSVCQDALL